MAPTKKEATAEKEAKLTPEQSAAMIMDYLRKQNRPYSATDISANLKNRVTKTAAAKLLKDMHERKEIEGRAAGKQSVYHSLQDEAGESSTEKLQQMDAETSRLRDETTALKAEEKELRAVLREDTGRMPLNELRDSVAGLELEKAEISARVAKLKSGSAKPISLEQREIVNKDHRKWQKTANARKKIRTELWKEVAEIVGKEKVEETKEELGLEF